MRVILCAAFLLSGCLVQNQTYASRAIIFHSGEVQLNWTASTNNPQGYFVEQSTDGVDFYQIQMVNSPSATVSSLSTGKTYYFRIRSYNEAGNSGYSAVVSAAIK
jgi:hypothetical protein